MMRHRFTEKIVAAAPSPPTTLSAAEADAWLGDLQRAERRTSEAATRIESAVAREPGLAIAQLALARLRLVQERPDEATRALSRAATLAPDDFLVQLSYGITRLKISTQATEDTVAALRRATAFGPNSPDAHELFAFAAMQSDALLPEAQKAIERAIQLLPRRLEFRLRFGEILAAQGAIAAARTVLRPLAGVKGNPDVAETAASHLKRLEAVASLPATADPRPIANPPAPGAEPAATPATATPAAVPLRVTPIPVNPPDTGGVRPARDRQLSFQLRKVGPGEERTFGRLTQVECRPGGDIRFHVTTPRQSLVVMTPRMSDVELTQFRDNEGSTLSCGARNPSDVVFVTWRAGSPAQPGTVGTAIAVEFMPGDFIP
jgi:Tfp pilus assembly protein PilF